MEHWREIPTYGQIWDLAVPYLKRCRPEDLLHTGVVVDLMQKIIEEEQLDEKAEVLIPAAILHDVGWSRVKEPEKRTPEDRIKHMKEGANIAQEVLTQVGFGTELIQQVQEIIMVHDNQYLGLPITNQLAQRLVEADNLWVLTEQSIGYYSKAKGKPVSEVWRNAQRHITKFDQIKSPTARRIQKELIENGNKRFHY